MVNITNCKQIDPVTCYCEYKQRKVSFNTCKRCGAYVEDQTLEAEAIED